MTLPANGPRGRGGGAGALVCRLVPVVVFLLAVVLAVQLWRGWVSPPTLVAEAAPVEAEVRPLHHGVLSGVEARLLQSVTAGQVLAQVVGADPRIMDASLALLRAEVEVMIATREPLQGVQRLAHDHDRLHLDWMRQRVELAGLRAQARLIESELVRATPLYRDGMITEQRFMALQAQHDALEAQVSEQSRLVEVIEPRLQPLEEGMALDRAEVDQRAMRAGLALMEEKLRLLEAQLAPVPLVAPLDGVVTAVLRRPGETVTAGEVVFRISSPEYDQLVGYLRQPLSVEPTVGMQAEVRTRTTRRETGRAQVVDVGRMIEDVPASQVQAIATSNLTERGLRIHLSKPDGLTLRPGEQVNVVLRAVGRD